MKLIILYGPPAVGKFTVGKELTKIIKYKLVHFHDFYDPLVEIFSEDNYCDIIDILDNYFINIFEKGKKLKFKGMIFTYTEIKRNNYAFMKKMIKKLGKSNVLGVKLNCGANKLYERVISPSRKKGYKTKSKKDMDWMLKNKDYSTTIPGIKTFELDNTNLSPKKAAQIIKSHFKLK